MQKKTRNIIIAVVAAVVVLVVGFAAVTFDTVVDTAVVEKNGIIEVIHTMRSGKEYSFSVAPLYNYNPDDDTTVFTVNLISPTLDYKVSDVLMTLNLPDGINPISCYDASGYERKIPLAVSHNDGGYFYQTRGEWSAFIELTCTGEVSELPTIDIKYSIKGRQLYFLNSMVDIEQHIVPSWNVE